MKSAEDTGNFALVWAQGSANNALGNSTTIPTMRFNGTVYDPAALTRDDLYQIVRDTYSVIALPSISYSNDWVSGADNPGYFGYPAGNYKVPGGRDYARIEVFPTVDDDTLYQMSRWVGARTPNV